MIGSAFAFGAMLARLRWNPERLRDFQLLRLNDLIRHAYDRVPFYRKRLDLVGVSRNGLESLDELAKLPLVTKRDLQDTPLSERSTPGSGEAPNTLIRTSGSTGTPLAISRSLWERRIASLIYMRSHLKNGYRPYHKMMGVARERPGLPFPAKWLHAMGLFRYDVIPIFLPLEERIDRLAAGRPDLLWGMKSALEIIAAALIRSGRSFPPPKLLIPGGDVLDGASRDRFERAFGVNPFDYYGASELGSVAWECRRHAGLHVNADSYIVEIVRDGKSAAYGEEGRVVCTSLFSYTSPLIRYDLGDIATFADRNCPCGVSFPLLDRIVGRLEDFVTLSDGRVLNWQVFYHFLMNYLDLRQYRIEQVDVDSIHVTFAADVKKFPDLVKRFTADLAPILKGQCRLEFSRVDEIPPDPSGKRRTIVSRVRPALFG